MMRMMLVSMLMFFLVMWVMDNFFLFIFFIKKSFKRFFVAYFFECVLVDNIDDFGFASLKFSSLEYGHQGQHEPRKKQQLDEIICSGYSDC